MLVATDCDKHPSLLKVPFNKRLKNGHFNYARMTAPTTYLIQIFAIILH